MNSTVTWTRAALRQFLDLWTTATDPDAVDAAALRIDQTLSADAHQQGESRTDPVRILFDSPLAVLFVADVDVAVAYVVSVGWSGATA
ncbi:hypothetical protein [Frigoriglobus tundricola]|uniref:Type II toxin-antitoxin system RelE/ParE family toxin n=1 Tax=Frigoriglobus tundricola TaxID=2774151 RepID=A0A6M5YNL5_9BACT|nr:hypothetical protein [Frigoriglobus tundricola]QJW95647.1 hypothetical protein FTUN_3201 [Frigoriglobus tundricola]